MQMTPPLWQKAKSLLMRVKEESEKASLKQNIRKMKIMGSSPITSQQTGGETMETTTGFIFLSYSPPPDIIDLFVHYAILARK